MFAAVCLLLCGCATQSLDEMSPDQLRVWLKGYPGEWREDTDEFRGVAPPSPRPVRTEATRIDLAEPDLGALGQMPVATALVHRRSRRAFTDEPLTLDDVGFLLWSAQGISGADLDEEGRIQRVYRTAPSAGARYPLETYLYVQRVEGLRPGLYRYLSPEHQLAIVREGDLGPSLRAACYGSPAVGSAAAVVVWTAVPYRTEWRYGYLAHRMIALEAGHACQNLYLAAESLGLGTCAMLAYDQARLDRLTGVDGRDEFVLYLAPVGAVP